MFVLRELLATDLLKLNMVNIDPKIGSFSSTGFYLDRLLQKDSPCYTFLYKEHPFGYIIGEHDKKKEEEEEKKYTHITAVSTSPLARRMRLGSIMIESVYLDAVSNRSCFVELFVRKGNIQAISLYRKNGYTVKSVIPEYYSDPEEDAYDMRVYIQ